MVNKEPSHALLFPHEVAYLFRVEVKTVTRWADNGKLPVVRTLGGHRRYPKAEILAILAANRSDPVE